MSLTESAQASLALAGPARSTCRVCGGPLDPVLDLGPIVPSDFLDPATPDPPALPLVCCRCEACGLVQLQHTVDPESLYRQYWYVSGTNETMRQELEDVAHCVRAIVALQAGDTVLDIGANDGTLLAHFPLQHRIAFEPARNLIPRLAPLADVVYNDFFPSHASLRLPDYSVKVCTSIAMFYDVDAPLEFVAEIDRLLTDDGVWILQFQDLASMIAQVGFDNLVAEHLCYYSLESFTRLLTDFDLGVAAVERRAINGGSLRIVVRRRSALCDRDGVVRAFLEEQVWTTPLALERFAYQVAEHRTQIQGFVEGAVDRYGYVDLYAASTKSSTLLQYCGLDYTVIRQAAERTPEKWGRVTSGTRIPCVSEEAWREDPAPISIVGAWQFAESFVQREREYLAKGGMFLLPLPQVRTIGVGR